MAYALGARAEISRLPRLKGFPAWIVWAFLRISMLLSNRNRFATLTNLAVRYLTKGSHYVIVGDVPDPSAQHLGCDRHSGSDVTTNRAQAEGADRVAP